MKTTISFLTQEGTQRLFTVISKRDRTIFLTAYRRYEVDTPAVLRRLWVPWEACQVGP